MKKTITLLGSTGSIGVQTLDVARMHHIRVAALTAKDARIQDQSARRREKYAAARAAGKGVFARYRCRVG